MSTELKKVIVDLKKKVENLTKELKTLRSFLIEMNKKNPYKWNKYYNQTKETKNQIEIERKINNQGKKMDNKLVNPQFKFKQSFQAASKSGDKKPEPMEVDKSSIHPNVGDSKKKGQFNPAIKREFQSSQQSSKNPVKYQRINKIENGKSCAKTIVEDPQPEREPERRKGNTKFNEIKDLFEPKSKVTERHQTNESKRNSIHNSSFFLQNKNHKLSFERHDKQTGKKVVGLIEIANLNNFITKSKVKHGVHIELVKPIEVQTKKGKVKITHYVLVNLFSHSLKFLIVEDLGDVDLTIGMNGLRQLNAKIDLMSFELLYRDKNKEN